MSWSYNPNIAVTTMVWANPRSLATTYGITFVFFSSAYLDVSVQRVHSPIGVSRLQRDGLPHSDICGSIRMCQSPQLFAAYHVLHRLWEPRHPPYALILLIIFLIYYNIYLTNLFFRIKSVLSTLFVFLFISICQWTFIQSNVECLNAESYLSDFITLELKTKIVENKGVEPLTSCVQGRRSSQLS